MFDLDRAIETWRSRFKKDYAFSAEDVEELECHLIDAYEARVDAGIEPEEAFRQSTSMLGDRKRLRSDYTRLKPISEHVFRAARLILVLMVFGLFVFSEAHRLIVGRPAQLFEGPSWGSWSYLYTLAAIYILPGAVVVAGIMKIDKKTLRYLACWVTGFVFLIHCAGMFLIRTNPAYFMNTVNPLPAILLILLLSYCFNGRTLFQASVVSVIGLALFWYFPPVFHLVETQAEFNIPLKTLSIIADVTMNILFGYGLSRQAADSLPANEMVLGEAQPKN